MPPGSRWAHIKRWAKNEHEERRVIPSLPLGHRFCKRLPVHFAVYPLRYPSDRSEYRFARFNDPQFVYCSSWGSYDEFGQNPAVSTRSLLHTWMRWSRSAAHSILPSRFPTRCYRDCRWSSSCNRSLHAREAPMKTIAQQVAAADGHKPGNFNSNHDAMTPRQG